MSAATILDEVRRSVRIMESLARLAPADVVFRQAPHPAEDLVSVVIPMRNAREWIEVCLKGLLVQTHSNLEVFCIDDCSTDDSYARVVEQFGADRRLCVVRLKRQVGPYQIKNWAIAVMVRGRFVAMQDADDVSHPARIAVQLDWMREHGFRVAGTYVHQFSVDGMGMIRGTEPAIQLHGELHNLVLYPTVPAVRTTDDFRNLFGERRFALAKHGSMLFEYAVLRELGGFDGRTRIVADTDLNWRLLRFMDIGNVPRVLYSRRIHTASLTHQPDTGYGSPAREAQRMRYDEMQREVARCLGSGDELRVTSLCRQDLFHEDVEVEAVHAGFDFGRGRGHDGPGRPWPPKPAILTVPQA